MRKKDSDKKLAKLVRTSHGDGPASTRLVKAVRNELKCDINALGHELKSVENRLDGKIDRVLLAVHGNQVLMEEQRSGNRIVLDGLKTVIERQNRIETELAEIRN